MSHPRDNLKQLSGLPVEDGWTIAEYLPKAAGLTGGHFSECYRARHADGGEGFLKAIDLHEALNKPDVLGALSELGDGAKCEQELLDKCKRMDRVVTMLAFGYIRQLNGTPLFVPIPYLIFERADGSIQRRALAASRPPHEWILRTLHHVSTGLMQLHRAGIAHQDLKLSNVLSFEDQQVTKIADLGRAVDRARPVFYEAAKWCGDWSYAPPEVAYGFHQSEFNARRFASDMYLFGSFACSLLIGRPMNVLLYSELPPQFKAPCFKGPYIGNFDSVLAHLQEAHDRAILAIEGCINATAPYRSELISFIRQWTDPDPRHRGHPLTHKQNAGGGNVYDWERYVSALPNLAGRARAFERSQGQ